MSSAYPAIYTRSSNINIIASVVQLVLTLFFVVLYLYGIVACIHYCFKRKKMDTKEDYVALLLEMYHKYRAKWDATDGAKEVQEFLGNREWNIRTAVCLGLTTFKGIRPHNPMDRGLDYYAPSTLFIAMWQFVAFMSVVDTLKAEGKPIAVHVYDPQINTEMEVDFLRALGVKLGPPDKVFDYITSYSFVFGRALPRDVVYADVLQRDPLLYIGDHPGKRAQAQIEVNRQQAVNGCGEALLQAYAWIAKEFHKTRKSMPFPGHEIEKENAEGKVRVGGPRSRSTPLVNMALCWREGDTTLPLPRQEYEEHTLARLGV